MESGPNVSGKEPIRVALATAVIPHFEVPLYRILASLEGISLRVFHADPHGQEHFDPEHHTVVDWGEDLWSGYEHEYHARLDRNFRNALWAWQPDVILQYGYTWPGALALLGAAKRRRVPVTHRGLLSPLFNGRQSRLARTWRLLRGFVLRSFDAHHFGGTFSKSVLEGAGIGDERSYFVPFSVDTPHFAERADSAEDREAAAAIRTVYGWSADDPVVLFMAQHSPVKGPDIVIDFVAEMQREAPDVKLIMAGHGAVTAQLQTQAASCLVPGSYAFPGFITSKKTVPYYLAADLVAFPSRYDTWGRAVNEAMLCRRPCILSDRIAASGGLVESGRTGIVVSGLDPRDYTAAALDFLRAPKEERLALGRQARDRAYDFSYEAHVDDLRHSLMDPLRRRRGA